MSESIVIPERPRLKTDIAVIRPNPSKGENYVLSDLKTGRNLRLNIEAYRVASLLDGNNNLKEVTRLSVPDGGIIIDQDADQIGQDVMNIIQTLAVAGMIDGAVVPEKFTKPKQSIQDGSVEKLAISSRHPLGDARPILDRWGTVTKFVFSSIGFFVWSILGLSAIYLLVTRSENIEGSLTWLVQMSPIEALLLTLAIIFGKFAHEMGHAAAIRQMSFKEGFDPGTIEIGVTRFYFFPLPYTDATTAWRIGSRFRRAVVALAGVYIEIGLASFAVLLWAFAPNEILQGVLIQFAVISAISTVLFNINPLIKLDGYYLMTDLLNVRNLAGRSGKAVSHIIENFVYGKTEAAETDRRLVSYGLGSFVYRCIISFGIAIAGAAIWGPLGAAIICVALNTLLLRPTIKFFNTYKERQPLQRASFVTASFIAILCFPMVDQTTATGIVEPAAVENAIAPIGSTVAATTDTSITFKNVKLDLEMKSLDAQRGIAEIELRSALKSGSSESIRIKKDLETIKQSINRLTSEKEKLIFQAAEQNSIAIFDADRLISQSVGMNQNLGTSYNRKNLQVRTIVPQRGAQKIARNSKTARIEIWYPRNFSPTTNQSEILEFEPIFSLPSPALSKVAGGSIVISPNETIPLTPTTPHFGAVIPLDGEANSNVRPGEVVTIKFKFNRKPIAFLLWGNGTHFMKNLLGL